MIEKVIFAIIAVGTLYSLYRRLWVTTANDGAPCGRKVTGCCLAESGTKKGDPMQPMKKTLFGRPGQTAFLAAFILLLLFQTPRGFAHSLYIQSTRYAADKGKELPLFFCYGHFVPVADGIRGKKLKEVRIIAPDGTIARAAIQDETSLHSHMVRYDQPGTWILTAETVPGYFIMYTDHKGRERHTIKPMESIREDAAKIHKSYYSKQYAKAYVSCEAPSNTFPARVGLALELVPVKDIHGLRAGDPLKLDVYMDGKPYAGQGVWDATYMGFSTVAEDHFHPRTAVTGPRLTIPIPNSGRWFVRYAVTVPAPEQERDKYLQMKLTTTLTFQIDNERKTPELKETDAE